MSNRHLVKLDGIADRLALCTANQAMRDFGWAEQPELYLESLVYEPSSRDTGRIYAAVYPLLDDRSQGYQLKMIFAKGDNGRWTNGVVWGEGFTGRSNVQMSITISWPWESSDTFPRLLLHDCYRFDAAHRQLVEGNLRSRVLVTEIDDSFVYVVGEGPCWAVERKKLSQLPKVGDGLEIYHSAGVVIHSILFAGADIFQS